MGVQRLELGGWIDSGVETELSASLHASKNWLAGDFMDHLCVWDMQTHQKILQTSPQSVGSVHFCEDVLVCARSDGKIRLLVVLNAETFEIFGQWRVPPQLHPSDSVGSLCFSPDHRLLSTVRESLHRDYDGTLGH
jgi:WD40 repeat protein